MIQSIVITNKTNANNVYPKFLIPGGDFDSSVVVGDTAALSIVTLSPGDFIVEPLDAYLSSEDYLVFYGKYSGTIFVITTKDSEGTPGPTLPYFIDGYSLSGTGTQSDPIRLTGLDNTQNVNGNLETTNNKIQILVDPVWFDGTVIGVLPGANPPNHVSQLGAIGNPYFDYFDNLFSLPAEKVFNYEPSNN